MRRYLLLASFEGVVPLMAELARQIEARGDRAELVATLPKERRWLRRLGVNIAGEDARGIARSAQEIFDATEIDALISFSQTKHGGTREHWVGRLDDVIAPIDAAFRAAPYDVAVIWNGQEYLGASVAALARRHACATIFVENGYLPNTLQVDPRGVNNESRIARASYDEVLALADDPHVAPDPSPGSPAQVAALSPVDRMRVGVARRLDRRWLERHPDQRGGETALQKRRTARRRAHLAKDAPTLEREFVLVALQVHDDTQILLNAPLVESLEAWTLQVAAAIREVFGNDVDLVVKEHPEDVFRRSYDAVRAALPDAIWVRNAPIEPLLDAARAVVVVNSSVGYQAMLRGKPVVTVGESLYAKPELTHHVRAAAELPPAVEASARGLGDGREAAIRAFDAKLREVLWVAGGWKAPTEVSVAALLARIDHLTAGDG